MDTIKKTEVSVEFLKYIWRTPGVKEYLQEIIGGFERMILKLSHPNYREFNTREIYSLHGKVDLLRRQLTTAEAICTDKPKVKKLKPE